MAEASRNLGGIDLDDPALRYITLELLYLIERYGLAPHDPRTVDMAITGGRKEHQRLAGIEARALAEATSLTGAPAGNVVYYVRVGDLIKIGTSGSLRSRLRAFPPTAELLATEPGDKFLERARHQMFATECVEGEWFTASERLIEWVNSLRVSRLDVEDFAAA